MPAVAGNAYRIFERRGVSARPGSSGGVRWFRAHRAGARPAPTGPRWGTTGVGAGRGAQRTVVVKGVRQHVGRRHCWLDKSPKKNTYGGWQGRGVAGAQPLHKGGLKARPPECEESGESAIDWSDRDWNWNWPRLGCWQAVHESSPPIWSAPDFPTRLTESIRSCILEFSLGHPYSSTALLCQAISS